MNWSHLCLKGVLHAFSRVICVPVWRGVAGHQSACIGGGVGQGKMRGAERLVTLRYILCKMFATVHSRGVGGQNSVKLVPRI